MNRTQEQLNKSFPTIKEAKPGDKLEDGCIVIEKHNGLVLIAEPVGTEVVCKWDGGFTPVFDLLKELNFNPSQWFNPCL